jgi:FkbM family methyltransferase
MIENLKETFNYLNNLDSINIVDVGAAGGGFKREVFPYITKSNFWVGIEPDKRHNNHGVEKEYDLWFQNAIDDVEGRKTMQFNINESSYCNSLLELNSEIITKDINQKNNLWYCPDNISTIISVEDVEVVSLKELFDEIPKFKNELIHFLKIDAQGVDIRVVKSLKEYIKKTMFIMMESIVETDNNLRLYKNQTSLTEDNEVMNQLGFKKLFDIDYSHICPEADVIYYNINLLNLD